MIRDEEIVELKINPTIDPNRFSIQPAGLVDGVRVNDSTGDQRVATYSGGRQDLWEERKRQLDEETQRMNAVLEPLPSAAGGTAAGSTGADGLPKPAIVAEVLALPRGTLFLAGALCAALVAVGVISIWRTRRKNA